MNGMRNRATYPRAPAFFLCSENRVGYIVSRTLGFLPSELPFSGNTQRSGNIKREPK